MCIDYYYLWHGLAWGGVKYSVGVGRLINEAFHLFLERSFNLYCFLICTVLDSAIIGSGLKIVKVLIIVLVRFLLYLNNLLNFVLNRKIAVKICVLYFPTVSINGIFSEQG